MRRLLAFLFLMILSACNLGQPTSETEQAPNIQVTTNERLVIAWIESGNLMVWQTGDTLPRRVASGGVVQPFIAPDGEHIVYTRGAQGRAETLWVVDTDGTAEQQLVGERPTTYDPGINQIGDVVWLDNQVIYFNTLVQRAPFYEPQNDLYRVNVITRELVTIANSGDGGRIWISPDGQHVVAVYHGSYGVQDAVIRRMDLLGRDDARNLLFFIGVATASEFRFYPDIYWLGGSSAVLVAIPDPDLIYSETQTDLALTQLWQIPVDDPSQRGLIGTVQASFFGLPQWSFDGSAMTYLQRSGTDNQFTAFLADGNGENPRAIFGGEVGTVDLPQWLPNSNQFYYARPLAGGGNQYFLGGVDNQPAQLSTDPIYQLKFVSDDRYVYVTEGDGRFEMRFSGIDSESGFVGSLTTVPIFDAVYVE